MESAELKIRCMEIFLTWVHFRVSALLSLDCHGNFVCLFPLCLYVFMFLFLLFQIKQLERPLWSSEQAPFCHLIAMQTQWCIRSPTITPYIWYDAEKVFLCIYHHLLYHEGFFIKFSCVYHFQTSVSPVSINMGEILSFYKKVVMLFSGLSWLSRSLPHCYRTLSSHEISWARTPEKLYKLEKNENSGKKDFINTC